MPLIRITDPADPRLGDYTGLTDVALRSKHEPAKGLYIAESSNVIRRAVEAGHRPRSFLMAEKWLESMAPVVAAATGSDQPYADAGADDADGTTGDASDGTTDDGYVAPVFVAEEPVLRAITGFHLHRGALAAMHRPPLASVAEVLAGARGGAGARRVAVLEDIVDHTNVGAMFRSAAALGVDAVLVTPRCADPLYRRSVRVSMGTVFQVPWTRLDAWPGGVADLRGAGFTVAALALSDDSMSLDDFAASPAVTAASAKVALVLGTEGDGLARGTVEAADVVVRIPMAGGVDSLNVAAASAVAFWATRV
ncbi:TrmH family RNA methyltransferase [Georgenia muralis]|uniref:tRNA G18 (Ribose-2'-O)-methylase SpoU n=1 Tax=Georgenia muralis TaxID=154117 RepID=A0A3N4ZRF5_9MICO|nr:RNA methyltransferase [Georgenia muralis]RPF28062.1 tRNA G18 (ribose-2'-O)-methylase SpoU [Georgenia muralis]